MSLCLEDGEVAEMMCELAPCAEMVRLVRMALM